MFPPGDEAYRMLAEGKCDDLLSAAEEWQKTKGGNSVAEVEGQDSIFLYRSAAEACLGRWDKAFEDFGRMANPPDLHNKCPRTQIFKWLSKLLDSRKADPGFSPVFVHSSESSPCPTDQPQATPEPTASSTDGSG
jgi:hypothetical protein